MSKIELQIISCLPGTGRDIADRVCSTFKRSDITPNIVYGVLLGTHYRKYCRIRMIKSDTGNIVHYFERKL